MSRLSDAQIDDLKARVDLAALARKFGAELRLVGGKLMGSCPLCGGSKKGRTTRFEIKERAWVCAACSEGGDALALVQKCTGRDFRAAVEFLGGAAQMDPAEEVRLEARRRAEAEKRERDAAYHRAQSIGRAWRMWMGAERFPMTPVEAYLAARGCALPGSAELRAGRETPYFDGEITDDMGRKSPRVVWRGPAMLAAVRDNAGEFCAIHITYLDPAGRGKARIANPDFAPGADEAGRFLPAKKVRAAKKGGHIVLRQPPTPTRLFMGEGIETVLSVASALRAAGRLRAGDAFWSAVDLGNLGGDALASVAHPFLTTASGRPQKVPGPVPDFEAPAIAIPETVADLILLGDGDSDAFTTMTTMRRAEARYARPGLRIRVAMAPAGQDFNDFWTGVAA